MKKIKIANFCYLLFHYIALFLFIFIPIDIFDHSNMSSIPGYGEQLKRPPNATLNAAALANTPSRRSDEETQRKRQFVAGKNLLREF